MVKSFGIVLLLIGAFFSGIYIAKPKDCGTDCKNQIITVSVNEFNKHISDKDTTLIDVRTPVEYKTGHIKGSKNADFNDKIGFDKFLNSLDKNNKYLVYCRSGNRSGQALELMEDKGFRNVINLSGGLLAWQSENLPLVTND